MQVSLDEIEATAKAALVNHGAEDWIAAEVAAAVREAEGLGNRICGLYYLESYCQQLRTGRVKGDSVPEVRKPRPGVVEVDAKFGFAQAAFSKALPEAARREGNGHDQPCGLSRAYLYQSGLFHGADRSGRVHRAGHDQRDAGGGAAGREIPRDRHEPDFLCGPGWQGRGGDAVRSIHDHGGAGQDHHGQGRGRDDPRRLGGRCRGQADDRPGSGAERLAGQHGGYKGWGFGLMAELLAAGMTGSRAGVDLGPLKAPEGDPHDIGDFYLIMDPDVSGGAFFDRLTQVSQAVQRDEGARMPGQARTVQDPVKVDPDAWALAQRLAGAD